MNWLKTFIKGLHQEYNVENHKVERARLREAKLIVPKAHFTREIKREIICHYRGATWWEGEGAWIDGWGELIEEPVVIISVATSDSDERLISMAQQIRAASDEKCLYLRLRDGEVVFVF